MDKDDVVASKNCVTWALNSTSVRVPNDSVRKIPLTLSKKLMFNNPLFLDAKLVDTFG